MFWVVCEEGMDRPLVWHHPPPPRNPQKATRVFRVEVPLPDVDKVDAVLRVHPKNVKLQAQATGEHAPRCEECNAEGGPDGELLCTFMSEGRWRCYDQSACHCRRLSPRMNEARHDVCRHDAWNRDGFCTYGCGAHRCLKSSTRGTQCWLPGAHDGDCDFWNDRSLPQESRTQEASPVEQSLRFIIAECDTGLRGTDAHGCLHSIKTTALGLLKAPWMSEALKAALEPEKTP